MIYAGVDSNGTDYNRNAWVVPGGGAGLVREGDGLRACQLRNGVVTPGIANPMSYNRPHTRDTFTVPFETSGEIELHSRAADPIIFGSGLRPHWVWGVTFSPVYVDEDNLIYTGFAPGATNWGASGQVDGKYGIARAERFTPPFDADAQFGGRHAWRMVVHEVGVHEVHWDGELVYRVVEKDPPAKWWTRPLRAGLRLDYYDYTLFNLTPGDAVTSFNWNLRVPYKYGNRYITLRDLEQIMLRDYHREYVRRFIGWLHYKAGNVGAGGLSRTEQPDGPGFAPSLYESFHWAGQRYNDGVVGACAVDTVFKDGPDPGDAHDGIPWHEVPIQGSLEALRWGIHANVGVPGKGESWHIQPIEIDGHASWVAAGRPAPRPNYPIPVEHDPYASGDPAPPPDPETPVTEPGVIDMFIIIVTNAPTSDVKETWLLCDGTQISHLVDGNGAELFKRIPGMHYERPKTADELRGVLKTCRTMNCCPPEWEGTGWEELWNDVRWDQ